MMGCRVVVVGSRAFLVNRKLGLGMELGKSKASSGVPVLQGAQPPPRGPKRGFDERASRAEVSLGMASYRGW